MTDNKTDMIGRLLELRIETGLNSKEFATKANIDPSNYSSIENGKRSLGGRVITDICRAFKVNPVWLKTGKGDKYTTAPAAPTANDVTMPREVFDQMAKMTETILSQQRTIEKMSLKGAADTENLSYAATKTAGRK